MYSSEPIGPGAASHEGMPCCASLKDSEALRVCLTVALVLIENQILDAQDTQLVQRFFMTICIDFFAALSFGLRDDLLEIRRDDQTGALLINLSNAIMKRAGSETICAAFPRVLAFAVVASPD